MIDRWMTWGDRCDAIVEARTTLSACRAVWLDYAWLFWPAQWYARSVAAGFRADLSVSWSDLGHTTNKFYVLIGQAEIVGW